MFVICGLNGKTITVSGFIVDLKLILGELINDPSLNHRKGSLHFSMFSLTSMLTRFEDEIKTWLG